MNRDAHTILIADDDSEARFTLSLCLSTLGHDVVCVSNGRQAMRAIEERPFDVIITDMLMPEADGVEVIIAARQAQPHAAIIAISGGGEFFAAEELLKSGRLLGADAQLQKPFSRTQLLEAVNRLTRETGVAAA